jgi:riboflavin biosynthesis pyrimidine reductase
MMIGWENNPAAAGQSQKSAEFAQIWQVSRKDRLLAQSGGGVHLAHADRARLRSGACPKVIKTEVSHELNVSGADLAASAWRADVIYECHVFVAPMLVGSGERMFPDNLRQPLELFDERRFANGTVVLRYAVRP